jgi:hypothetical protein
MALAVGLACLPSASWQIKKSSEGCLKVLLVGGTLAGSGVLWSWVTMRLCGVCRPIPAWTDRLGRLTGTVWIALGTVGVAYMIMASL